MLINESENCRTVPLKDYLKIDKEIVKTKDLLSDEILENKESLEVNLEGKSINLYLIE